MDLVDSRKLRQQVVRMRQEVAVYRLKTAPWLVAELHSAYSQFADELSGSRSPGLYDRSPGPPTSHRPN
jgi:hypothetical protein